MAKVTTIRASKGVAKKTPPTLAESGDASELPLIFISHKHVDKEIAKVLADWIDDVTGGYIGLFVSSDAEYETPIIGADLTTELGKNLKRASVVILIYTTDEYDWSYCTWECGVATNPGSDSANTKVICIQCLPDNVPKILGGTKMINAWEEDSVVLFAKMFLDENFIPGADGPATKQSESRIIEKGKRLRADLASRLPEEPMENWSAWPFMRLEIPIQKITECTDIADPDERVHCIYQSIIQEATILQWSPSLPGLFGKADVVQGSSFGDLIEAWQAASAKHSDDWIYTLSQQMLDSYSRNVPQLKEWARFRAASGNSEYFVGMGRIRRRVTSMTFDCYFYRLIDVPLVEARMNRIKNMYYKDLSTVDPSEITIKDIILEMKQQNRTRLPILDNGKAKYVVHGSLLDRFICNKAFDGEPVEGITLTQLLADDAMRTVFSSSFICVSKVETIDSAVKQMNRSDGCQDIFVTADDDLSGSVVGWLTDRDLIDNGV